MKNKALKLTTLSMLMIGASQFVQAEDSIRSTLPKFQAKEIPALCDAKIQQVKTDLAAFEQKKIKNNY